MNAKLRVHQGTSTECPSWFEAKIDVNDIVTTWDAGIGRYPLAKMKVKANELTGHVAVPQLHHLTRKRRRPEVITQIHEVNKDHT